MSWDYYSEAKLGSSIDGNLRLQIAEDGNSNAKICLSNAEDVLIQAEVGKVGHQLLAKPFADIDSCEYNLYKFWFSPSKYFAFFKVNTSTDLVLVSNLCCCNYFLAFETWDLRSLVGNLFHEILPNKLIYWL